MQIQAMTVNQLLTAIYEQQSIYQTLWQEIALRARILAYTQEQYQALHALVASWIDLAMIPTIDTAITTEWGLARDALIAHAHPLIDDDPIV